MESVRCYDVVKMVLDEATEQFGSLMRESEEERTMIENCCSIIDELSVKFGGVSYEAGVEDKTLEIIISLVCEEFETDAVSSGFCELFNHTKKIKFSSENDEMIKIEFIFEGLWQKAF